MQRSESICKHCSWSRNFNSISQLERSDCRSTANHIRNVWKRGSVSRVFRRSPRGMSRLLYGYNLSARPCKISLYVIIAFDSGRISYRTFAHKIQPCWETIIIMSRKLNLTTSLPQPQCSSVSRLFFHSIFAVVYLLNIYRA